MEEEQAEVGAIGTEELPASQEQEESEVQTQGSSEESEVQAQEAQEARETQETQEEMVEYSRFKEVYGQLKRTQREVERLKAGDQEQKPLSSTQPTDGKPNVDDFNDYESYIEALTDWKLAERDNVAAKEREKEQHEAIQKKWDDQVSAAVVKDPDFLEKGYIPVPLVPLLAETDKLAEFAYYFHENPGEAHKLLSMSQIQAAREIGMLEAGFKSSPPQRTKTKAPKPTSGVIGAETPKKNPQDMSYEEYKAWRKTGGGK